MISDKEILEVINKAVRNERGKYLNIDSKYTDAELDSLGITMSLMEIDDKYDFFKKVGEGQEVFAKLDIPNLTVRKLVELCK